MILKMNRKSKGKKGVVEYLLNEREAQGTAQTLRGNPELTKSLIKHINRKHKYLSGGLMFAKEEYLNDIQQKEIMDSFEELLFTGLDQDQYHVLWVRHTDKNRLELNFVVPRIELNRGIDLDLYSHKRDLPVFDMWKNGINKKYDLADPNDPARARSKSEQNKHAPFSGSIIANREKLDETLYELVQRGEIKSRSHMLELLESSGYQIARKGAEYISIKHTDIGKKSLRLRGGIFSENFTSTRSIESIIKNGEQRARRCHIGSTQKEIGKHRAIYKKYLQTRNERHKKRYCKPRKSDKKKPWIAEERNQNNLDRKTNTQSERINIDDRIRKFIETSNSKRTEYTKEAREGETQLLAKIRNSNIRLSNRIRGSEQELLESLANTRSNVEENIRRNTDKVLQNLVREDARDKSFAIGIHGLLTELQDRFSSLKKSIKGAIDGIKKLKIFNSAKEEMMSDKEPTITLSPRR